MTCKLRPITADPFPVPGNLSCYACGHSSRKMPTTTVIVTEKSSRSERMSIHRHSKTLLLNCREKHFVMFLLSILKSRLGGSYVILEGMGRNLALPLQSWKQRTCPSQMRKTLECYICQCLETMHTQASAPHPNLSKRNVPLMQLFLYTRESQERFCFDLSWRSRISISDAWFLPLELPKALFCYFHHIQTRHSKTFSSGIEPTKRGEKHGFCIFRNNGCLRTSLVLRPLRKPRLQSLEDVESYSDLEDAVMSHCSRALKPGKVIGKQACGTCRYILTKASNGTKPLVDNAVLKCATDSCLVDRILFALDKKAETDMDTVNMRGNVKMKMEALKLNGNVVALLPDVPNACFLPITELQKL